LFRVLLRLRGTKKFLDRPNFLLVFKSLMNPLHLLKIVFPKFKPLTATGMALCVDIGPKCQDLFSLV
jgi:hypothetical protein